MMNYFANYQCDLHPNPFDCPDNIITYNEESDEYGLIFHDGTESFVAIQHCPWCGKNLRKVKEADSKVKSVTTT